MQHYAAGDDGLELTDSDEAAIVDEGAGDGHPLPPKVPTNEAAIAQIIPILTPLPTLTPKQAAFADAYMITGNASEAYRRAYDVNPATMQAKTVRDNASVLLRHGGIAAAIATRRAEAEAGVLAALVAAKVAAPGALERIERIAALDPETHVKQLAPILRANESVAGIAGIMPRGGGVVVNVGGDHRRIDERAIELWEARKQRERIEREAKGDGNPTVDP